MVRLAPAQPLEYDWLPALPGASTPPRPSARPAIARVRFLEQPHTQAVAATAAALLAAFTLRSFSQKKIDARSPAAAAPAPAPPVAAAEPESVEPPSNADSNAELDSSAAAAAAAKKRA